MTEPINIAVVGHANSGKTSLMRTLTRQRHFGEVSSRPATTRHVEAAELAIGNDAVMRLYDTPGLEDSSGLLVCLDRLRGNHGGDWTDAIDALIATPELQDAFGQEAKALAQLRRSDIVLYVIDARDAVRARHRDELEVLARCAVPVLPVLNFVSDPAARTATWRDQLARVNMHAVIVFDTVVYDETGEQALYDKIAAMAERFAPTIRKLTDDLALRRRQIRRASARIIADLLIDAAAARRAYRIDDSDAESDAAAELQARVRAQEAQALKRLLSLHGFDPGDARLQALDIAHGQWEDDLFDPATLARYGVSMGTAAATGAVAGVAIDVMAGGTTLGGGAAIGATVGFLADAARLHGGRLMARMSGIGHVRVAESALTLLVLRQVQLVVALAVRGHGAVRPMDMAVADDAKALRDTARRIARSAARARQFPAWSGLNGDAKSHSSARRDAMAEALATELEAAVKAVNEGG